MSLSVEQLMLDAKLLVNELKQHECTAEVLIGQSQAVCTEIETLKQYADHLNELNEKAGQLPYTVYVAEMHRENRHFRELQQENRELRSALEEHQEALEFIMTKYKQQIQSLSMCDRSEIPQLFQQYYQDVIQVNADKIQEMAGVMLAAVQSGNPTIKKKELQIKKLVEENQRLRKLLNMPIEPYNPEEPGITKLPS